MKRVIPTILIQDGRCVKTKKFSSPIYLGDPINIARIFNNKYVDELIILDISQGSKANNINYELLEKLSSQCLLPLTYGGHIHNVEAGLKVIKKGFEKIIVRNIFSKNPNVVKELEMILGKQALTLCIDFICKDRVYFCINNNTSIPLLQFLENSDLSSFGEIVLHNVDREGTYLGIDFNLIKLVTEKYNNRFIYVGGTNSPEDFENALKNTKIVGVGIGSLFSLYGKFRTPFITYKR